MQKMAILALLLIAPALGQTLTAGDIDDNLNWEFYQQYSGQTNMGQYTDFNGSHWQRLVVRVTDNIGDPVPFAQLLLGTGGDGVEGTSTKGDGVGMFHRRPTVADWDVAVTYEGERHNVLVASDTSTVAVQLNQTAKPVTALDLMLVIDTTGSMSDELSYLQDELEFVISHVHANFVDLDMRFGLVVYRDEGDAYVTRAFDFVSELETMLDNLRAQSAGGGGDYPEALDAAIREGVQAEWRADALRQMIVVADAPAHEEQFGNFLDAVRHANEQEIQIHTVGASGVGDKAELLLRHAAVMTGGRYMFLTDDSGIGNAHKEPTVPCYQVTEFKGLLGRVISSGVAGERIEANEADLIRTVGEYDMGVCLTVEPSQGQSSGPSGSAGAALTSADDGSGESFALADPVEFADLGDPADPVDPIELVDPSDPVDPEPASAGKESPGLPLAILLVALVLFARRYN